MAKNPARNKPAKIPENLTLNGSNTLPAQIEIAGGAPVPLGDVVVLAFQKSGLEPEAWNEMAEADRDAALVEMIGHMERAVAEAVDVQAASLTASPPPVLENVTTASAPETVAQRGPVARQEVRYRGRTYPPGARLPVDIDRETLGLLDEYDAI